MEENKNIKSNSNNINKDFIEIVGVNFRPAGSIYYYDKNDLEITKGTSVIVDGPKGEMFGKVVYPPVFVPRENAIFYDPINRIYSKEGYKAKISSGSLDGTIDHDRNLPKYLSKVKRIASDTDKKQHDENIKKTAEINKDCKIFIKKHKLKMKLVRSELSFNQRKLSVFYTADNRVDFKPLIEELLKAYKGTRIELRQIDARNEAKIIGGLAPCGQETCCSTFNINPPQVNIKNLKDQNISLNPSKINGLCGKLKCCFSYEIDVYKDIKENLPKIEKYLKVKTEDNVIVAAKLIRINVLARTITAVDESGSFVNESVDNIVETSSKPYWK